MARKLRVEYRGAIYHVAVRGNARQDIFLTDEDRMRWLRRLDEAAGDYGVRVYVYCLMTNHVHLVVETPRGNLGRFMESVVTGYAVYFNRKHGRVGHVTQGRYTAQVVSGDKYLLRLGRYVHLNPVRTSEWEGKTTRERKEGLRNYRWSTYRGYAGYEVGKKWVDYGPMLGLAGGRRGQHGYRMYVERGLDDLDSKIQEMLKPLSLAIGGRKFVEKIRGMYEGLVACGKVKREDVSFRKVQRVLTAGQVMAMLCEEYGFRREDLTRKRRDGRMRAAACWLLIKYAGLTQRKVAEELGMKAGASVSDLLKRYRESLAADERMNRILRRMDEAINRPLY